VPKVGLVGLGNMGKVHYRILQQQQRVWNLELRVCDPCVSDPLIAKSDWMSYEDLLSWAEVIILATPTNTHVQLAQQAVDCGHSVFVEKPLAFSLKEAKKLKLKDSSIVVVGYVERFSAIVQELRRLLRLTARTNDLPLFITTSRVNNVAVHRAEGLLIDLGVHDFDLITHLFGDPSWIDRALVLTSNGIDVFASVDLRLDASLSVNTRLSWIDVSKARQICVYSKDSVIQTDLLNSEIVWFDRQKRCERYRWQARGGEPVLAELEMFFHLVNRGGERPPDDQLGLKSLAVADAVQIARDGYATRIQYE